MGSRCVALRNIPKGAFIHQYSFKHIKNEPYLLFSKHPNTYLKNNTLLAYKDIKVGEYLTFSFMPQIKK